MPADDGPVYAIAYHQRAFLEWCAAREIAPDAMVYAPSGPWLRKRARRGLRYRVCGPEAYERKDWPTILDALVALEAQRVGG